MKEPTSRSHLRALALQHTAVVGRVRDEEVSGTLRAIDYQPVFSGTQSYVRARNTIELQGRECRLPIRARNTIELQKRECGDMARIWR